MFGDFMETRDLKIGKQIIMQTPAGYEFAEVKTNNYKEGLTVELKSGKTIYFDNKNYSATWRDKETNNSGYYLKWMGPIPNMEDEAVLNYLKILGEFRNKPVLIQIEDVVEGRITGNLITSVPKPDQEDVGVQFDINPREHPEINFVDEDGVRTINLPININTHTYQDVKNKKKNNKSILLNVNETNLGIKIDSEKSSLSKGDVVIIDEYAMYFVKDELITVPNLKNRNAFRSINSLDLVCRNASPEDIKKLLFLDVREENIVEKPKEADDYYPRLRVKGEREWFMSLDQIENEHWAAYKRLEPDEILVLWLDKEGETSETEAHIMGNSGYMCAVMDSLSDYMYGMNQAEGLWVMKNVNMQGSYSYEGEYDCELEGDFVPATKEDVERLFGGDMNADIIDALNGREIDGDVTDLAEYFIDKARLNADLENENRSGTLSL